MKVHGGIMCFKRKVHVLCLVVDDENWRVGDGCVFKDFSALLRNLILDNWEPVKIFKQRSDMTRGP